MKKLYFDDYIEFCAYIIDRFAEIKDTAENPDISIIAKYEDAKGVIKELCSYDCEIMDIDIHAPDFDGYSDEYVISLTDIDKEKEIWCEPMRRKNGYLNTDSVIAFFFNNCSDTALEHCGDNIIYKVWVGSSQQEEPCTKSDYGCNDTSVGKSESIYVSRDSSGNPIGFNKGWSVSEDGHVNYFSYSCYSDDIEKLKKVAEELGIGI